MTEEIVYYILSLLPSIVAIGTSIGTIITFFSKFKTLRKDVKEKVEMKELSEKLECSISRCKELEETLKESIEFQKNIKEE